MPLLSPIPRPGDARKEARVTVSWRAKLLLPNGQWLDARVRDISESGLGVLVPERVVEQQPLTLSITMPDLDDPSQAYLVNCRILPIFVVLRGHDYHAGAQWLELHDSARALIKAWIKRIQHGL
jgi:hypothetical protein